MLTAETVAWRAGAADDADQAATRADEFVDQTRRQGVRDALAVLRGAQIMGTYPKPERCADVARLLAASVEKQARVSGLGRVTIPVGSSLNSPPAVLSASERMQGSSWPWGGGQP